jgi:hypothetical protein
MIPTFMQQLGCLDVWPSRRSRHAEAPIESEEQGVDHQGQHDRLRNDATKGGQLILLEVRDHLQPGGHIDGDLVDPWLGIEGVQLRSAGFELDVREARQTFEPWQMAGLAMVRTH